MKQQVSWKDVFWSKVVMAAGWTLAWSPPSLGSLASVDLDGGSVIVFAGGLAIGAAQWAVTTRRFGASAWWLVVYGLGWSAGLWVGFKFSFIVPDPLWMGGIGGALVGLMQWLTLRHHLRHAVWWMPASLAIGLVTCWLGVFSGSTVYNNGISEESAYLIGAAVCGALMGALTSLALQRFTVSASLASSPRAPGLP